jgi:hypothetical protein
MNLGYAPIYMIVNAHVTYLRVRSEVQGLPLLDWGSERPCQERKQLLFS